MKKLISCLGLMMALSLATGCTFYFGPDDDDDSWGDDAPPPDGWSCGSDYDCAAGCYCDATYGQGSGYCVEAGYCSSDAECGYGYTCDEARNSCIPDGYPPPPPPPPPMCSSDEECAAGCYCDEANGGYCVETGYCATDDECAPLGQVCDEDRQTCVPEDPTPPPPPPVACNEIYEEQACVDRDDCVAIYAQLCYDPAGNSCQAGSTNCVCDGNYSFVRCDPLMTP